jgi:taurine dioxygenase
MSKPALHITPLSPALGAEIGGVDLSQDISDGVIKDIRQALLDHLVIFFRDQDITPDQHLVFARRFGDLVSYPMVAGLKDHPEIVPVVKLTYLETPPMGAILVARELPPHGGDTLFANMNLAFETLSDGMKTMLSGLTAINSSAKGIVAKSREDRQQGMDAMPEPLISQHPAVRTHPETGKKILFVNIGHTTGFKGMTAEESAPLLEFLFAHQRREEFAMRFSWLPGSIAFWDNRASQHYPLNDYHGHRRVLHRVTLAGDVPV